MQNEKKSNKELSLDNEQRVKVLSPGMLVAKRFFRNKLAMIGLIILIAMFLFSFVGGMLMPYTESQVFRKNENVLKDYAVMSENIDFIYTNAEGKDFPAIAGANMILAINKNEKSFEAKGVNYSLIQLGEASYQIAQLTPLYRGITLKGKVNLTSLEDGRQVSQAVKSAYEGAAAAEEDSFELDGTTYYITKNGKESTVSSIEEIALASKLVYHSVTPLSYGFQLAAEKAIAGNASTFEFEGTSYGLELLENGAMIMKDGENYAVASRYSIQPVSGQSLPFDFVLESERAVLAGEASFVYTDSSGTEIQYKIEKKAGQVKVRSEQLTQLNDTYSSPGKKHLLGTDGNGMDVLTRLMYGGRISLMIGFVAIFIEILIGVVIGGLAGYFGKWVDTILMRVVDVVICIPALPLYIILGSIMDYYQVDPRLRIYLLCAILGIISWPSIARMVRGQILSFREQEFMTATEATGISIFRRIFKHLIPNVIPNLIVIATMGLGEIILMEATLSFLGLGVKFPYASWGNIINSVNDVFVMQNYLFLWIPAGLLILVTVLGFNFVGDGLRDAFDPKMKR